jgi:hypothetical protein
MATRRDRHGAHVPTVMGGFDRLAVLPVLRADLGDRGGYGA